MRKPLVVVCAAASALVLAGGAAATAAGAEEVPDEPGWSFVLPGFPGFSGFGGPGMSDSGPAADDAGLSDDAAWTDDHAGADRPGTADRPDAADRPGQQRPAPQRPAQQPGLARPAPQRPAAQRPAQERPDRQVQRDDAGAGLLAAAREGVTAADVSSSPAAPVQQRVLALVNDNRQRYGCAELSVDRRLIEAANEHAADMARRRYFAHESPNGNGAGERVREAGYRWKRYGENIARGADSPYEVVDGWMHSPSHRRNILDCRLHQMGIGLAIAGDRTPYWVQDFATPDS
jgi:uncharacterized protein YkwD